MKKKIRMIVALLLAAVIVSVLPMSALATSMSGSHNGYAYTCYAAGSTSLLSANMSYGTTSKLMIDATPKIQKPESGIYVNVASTCYESVIGNNSSYISLSCTYSQFYANHPSVPSNGRFKSCQYDFRIKLNLIESWSETFV